MNTSSLKTFAQNARNKLRAQVAARLNYWLGAEGGTAPDTAAHRQFAPQIKELAAAMRKETRDGLVERISYTWFNRLVALRFMDANDFHPFGARVVSPATDSDILPQLLQEARAGTLNPEIRAALANPQSFDDILAGLIPVAHPEAEAYAMLLLAACNYYHATMPFLFEKLGDATQLLLPEDLLSEHSILTDIRENLSKDDCAEVDVIGWLYQFYISERKDTVMSRKGAVPTEDIPAVTQLFTPHWIVRYLVENSLGRLWLLNRPHSRLREHMPYYIEGETEKDFLKIGTPEEIKLLDPACGSAHMLTYAFDLLYRIYEEEGYDAPEIPSLILRHNLHGTEICDRAAALAAFALCMKARAKDRRFFKRLSTGRADAPNPHIIEMRELRFEESELSDYIRTLKLGNIFQHTILKLLHQFEEAKNFGSLIQPCETEAAILEVGHIVSDRWSEMTDQSPSLFLRETHLKVLRVLEQAEALTQRYHVVVVNPPYLGKNQMNADLKGFSKTAYPISKADLFSMFIERTFGLTLPRGFSGMITMQSWMFLSTFEGLRAELMKKQTLHNMAHLGARAFDTIGGEVVQATAFTYENNPSQKMAAVYLRLTAGRTEAEKATDFLHAVANQNCTWLYRVPTEEFRKLPGSPIAYWVGPATRAAFEDSTPVGDQLDVRQGMATTDNSTYLRHWHEIAVEAIEFGAASAEAGYYNGRHWFPYNKGGSFRKWYGNNDHIIKYTNNGDDLIAMVRAKYPRISDPEYVIKNRKYYFRECVTWSFVSSAFFGARRSDKGFIFDVGGSSGFAESAGELDVWIALLCSSVCIGFLKALNPTVNFQVENIQALPQWKFDACAKAKVGAVSIDCQAIARTDWDNFETSWDFRDQPLLRPGLKGATLEASWRNWEAQSTAAIRRMQELETENNRLFIAAYGLEGELEPTVPEEQITLARADARSDMAAFLSYAVGCMMGRYSPDQPGLILADAGATLEEFRATIEDRGSRMEDITFTPDDDAIIPVLDGEWFTDDIVGRFREFLRVTFGEVSFAANLRFIEESLAPVDKKTGKTKTTDLRTYFVRDFYKNHLSNERAYGYKKRPIYWMVSSPNGSFQALIYLHRYTRDTMNHLLDRYVRPFIDKLEQRQQACTVISTDDAAKPAARTAAQKELIKLGKMLKEIREWERDSLLPIAQHRIDIDLDDGVKVNYLKFKGVLVPIPGLEKKEED